MGFINLHLVYTIPGVLSYTYRQGVTSIHRIATVVELFVVPASDLGVIRRAMRSASLPSALTGRSDSVQDGWLFPAA